jgi:hypothetical protein
MNRKIAPQNTSRDVYTEATCLEREQVLESVAHNIATFLAAETKSRCIWSYSSGVTMSDIDVEDIELLDLEA